ncbi:N-(5'-phosphoribosyl)anthranilate isomerase [bioreactor metagenome]|uniref:phosphoribosylanthranilate isomerase n=1 Tax=bioreactor metagenome TaxID=1076179 RepID=A0A645DID6_9ZZZZ
MDAPIERIVALFRAGVITMAQLHGREDEAYIRRLKDACGIPVIKAVRVETAQDILARQTSLADFLLLDNGAGGTGSAFNWGLIPSIEKPCFLAGGIHEGNLEAALALCPYCVDVSSGAESGGFKDREKILRLVRGVRRN